MHDLTVVIPNRNRLDPHSKSTQYLFGSLENQVFKNFEIIVVDGGSNNFEDLQAYLDSLRGIKKSIIQHNLDFEWNKCLLNNIGIQNSKSKYVMTTDADMLFGQQFIRNVVKNLKKDTFVESRTMYLKSSVMKKVYNGEIDFYKSEDKCKQGRVKKRTTCGGCQATSLENWHSLKGYNEKMVGWGSEDQELLKRAELLGLKIIWLGENNDIMLFHQEHSKNDIKEDLKYQEINKIILNSCSNINVNEKGWGK